MTYGYDDTDPFVDDSEAVSSVCYLLVCVNMIIKECSALFFFFKISFFQFSKVIYHLYAYKGFT